MLDLQSVRSFSSELEKIAYETSISIEEVRKDLKPGDILSSRPRPGYFKGKPFEAALRPILMAFQGTPYTHIGLYTDDDKVINSGSWKNRGPDGVRAIPLKEYAKRYQFRALRVDAPKEEINDAIDYAKDQIGKPYSTSKVLRLALPVSDTKEKRKREHPESVFCSELIANAYASKNFAAKRRVHHVRPIDIQRSTLTRIVAEHK